MVDLSWIDRSIVRILQLLVPLIVPSMNWQQTFRHGLILFTPTRYLPRRCYQHYCCRHCKRKPSSSKYKCKLRDDCKPLPIRVSCGHPRIGVPWYYWANVGTNSKNTRAVRSTVREFRLNSCQISFLSFGIIFVRKRFDKQERSIGPTVETRGWMSRTLVV